MFGEVLLWRARNTDTAYAAPVNGTVPAGSVGTLHSEFDFGYRIGLTKAFDSCHSIVATYTGFISENDDQVSGTALSKLLIHPGAFNAASDALTASGNTALDFHVFDLDYRFLLRGGDCSAINMLIGARYAHMEQEIGAIYQPVGIVDAVSSDIDFDGAGLRLGLDAEHHVGHGLYGYGKANASFLAGEFDASYLNTRDGAYVSSSDFNAARLVTILDLEVGAGWQATENCRLSAGYSVSGWFNSVTTADWIDGVRDDNNHFADMSQAITFDGFNARAEMRF
ncbi:Lpg1974 family pore-forming outer membrane protein [Allorhodopirellula solitaria]|uniref:Lpg1974 family pore-forming outer membrane protein n=1 Tax=Allorhodopirellula solitaria TaxID=2527987 RepID=UPI001647BA54|nr:Lpg1974 family pore-forming outer membrane protein [Allorhodopirellula solitaria]